MDQGVGYHRLHPDRSLEFQLNRFLQYIGPDALPEIRAAAAGIHDYAGWTDTFLELAKTARDQRRTDAAGFYDRAAEFFMPPGDPRRRPARERFLADLRSHYGVSPVCVPYPGGALPAYDLVPDGPVRGTIVLSGGFDEYVEENLPLIPELRRSGYRVIAFDGPGQGGALEDHGLPMTEAWERPVGAVLDHFGLADVTLVGLSLGGCLAVRAAAFEPRVRRVVALDVMDDFLECLGRQLFPGAAPALRLLLAAGARGVVNRAARAARARKPVADWGIRQGRHVTGTDSAYDFPRAARRFTTRGVSALVTADVLLMAGVDDHYVPLRQLHRQAAALTRARSVTTRTFTAAEQAQNHCQIGNVGAAMRVLLAWLRSVERD